MKTRSLLSLILILTIAFGAKAQDSGNALPDYDHKVEITPLVGYQLNGNINFVNGDITFQNNINYGVGLAVNVNWSTFVEASYSYCASEANMRLWYAGDFDNEQFDVNIHYIQISGVKEFLPDRFRPFGMLGAGVAGFTTPNPTIDDWWQFAINLGAGVKIHLSERIGIRLQGRMLLPMYFNGFGFFCGIGSGGGSCGGGVTTTSTTIQGDFSGGLIIGF